MTKKRSNLINLLLLMAHWLIADAVAILSFLLMISFSIDKDPETANAFMSGKLLYANIPLFIIGSLILLAGYFFVWKLWLKEDWLIFKANEAGPIFTVLSITVEVLNMIILFFAFFAIEALTLNWANFEKGSRFVDYSILFFILYMLVCPLYFFLIKKPEVSNE